MTIPCQLCYHHYTISTHILTKRMTIIQKAIQQSKMYFNSHPHEEDDLMNSLNGMNVVISTHILTKRMTEKPVDNSEQIEEFQLTSSRRGWLQFPSSCCPALIFQLTSSRRGWRETIERINAVINFNSHPHEEDDAVAVSSVGVMNSISTHILTKRMTRTRFCTTTGLKHFNSHPHEEDDFYFLPFLIKRDISTHILTKRMTELNEARKNYRSISTHILTKRMTSM